MEPYYITTVKPGDLYRTSEFGHVPEGYVAFQRHFKIDSNGEYFKDENKNYHFYPVPLWICIPNPYLDPNLPKPPPKPPVKPNMVARFECFRIAEDGFFVLDSNDRPIYENPRWIIERDNSKFTLQSMSNNK